MSKRKPSDQALLAAELLDERARITTLPESLQGHVRAAFSELIDYRVRLLDYWRQVPAPQRRTEAAKIARAWARKAQLLGPLYPCLTTTYPMPRVLDEMVGVLAAGRSPGRLAALVLDLDHLRLDEKAAARVAQEAAR